MDKGEGGAPATAACNNRPLTPTFNGRRKTEATAATSVPQAIDNQVGSVAEDCEFRSFPGHFS